MLRFYFFLSLGLLTCAATASLRAAEPARNVAMVQTDIEANAAAITASEATIRSWDNAAKLVVLADTKLTQWATERDAASVKLNTINGRWIARYDEDPQARAWQKSQQDLEKQINELSAKPGNEDTIAKLGAERQNYSAQLSISRPRLEPDMDRLTRVVDTRNGEIFNRLIECLRKQPDGKDLITKYEQALVRRATLDTEWLTLQGLTRALPYLKSLPKLVAAKGNTLPLLTRYAYSKYDFDFQKELAERWGYCLSIPGYFDDVTLDHCRSSVSLQGRLVALVKSDPKRYKLQVVANRGWPAEPGQETWCRDASGKVLNAQAKSFDGTLWTPGMDAVISPAAPDAVWQECGRMRAEPIAGLRKLCPIAMVISGGEYGLGVLGFANGAWGQDPKVQKARGEKPWFEYISMQKGRECRIIADALRAAVPDRDLYIYYTLTGGDDRNRYGGWSDWSYDPALMKGASDLASDQHYLSGYNTGFTCTPEHLPQGCDIFTGALNSRGRDIAVGLPLAYSWLWASSNPEYDRPRWLGLLKMLYTTGIVGANVGNYNMVKDEEFEKPFPVNKIPYWLDEIISAARVQTLFTHAERFLRKGDLLPGPNQHVYSKDQPAYEFPTGDADARVVARKLKDQPEWLITAWAAGGVDRPVNVDIPSLGKLTVQARIIGTVYTATLLKGKAVVVQLAQDDPLTVTAPVHGAPKP